jgi:hypothetical protein
MDPEDEFDDWAAAGGRMCAECGRPWPSPLAADRCCDPAYDTD